MAIVGYLVAARWVTIDGEEEHVLETVKKVIEPSRAEPGCLMYQASQDPDDRRRFFFAEVYRDEAAFRAHTESPHFRELVLGEAVPRLAERERAFYVTIDG